MKGFLIAMVFLGLLVFPTMVTSGEDKKLQRFGVTFTIKYNSLTLGEAAALEKQMRDENEKACSVVVDLERVRGGSQVTSDAGTFYFQ